MTDNIYWNDLSVETQHIGSGSYGDVYKTIWNSKDGPKTIAIKKFRAVKDLKESEIEKEIRLLSLAQHDNIVKLYGCTEDENKKIVMVMEYSDYGSVSNIVHGESNGNMSLPHSRRINWMIQCARGVEYLHNFSPKILHRDLNPKNLLLFNNFRTLKICDFGTVKQLATIMSCVGTAPYMAPEVSNIASYTEKCDVYSFGITFWEVMSRKKPFYNFDRPTDVFILKIAIEGSRPNVNDIEDFENRDQIVNLMQQCWNGDAKGRPTMQNVIQKLNLILNAMGKDECDTNILLQTIECHHITLDALPIDSFAMIHKATWKTKDGDKAIAAKLYNCADTRRSIEFKTCLKHENILDLYGITEDNDKRTILLMEYAECGSLAKVLLGQRYQTPNYSYLNALKWMLQCAKGLAHLREQNIIYCDLSPTKLFLANNFQTLKILYSNLTDEYLGTVIAIENTNYFKAPEIQHGNQFSGNSDTYSFGLILWVVVVVMTGENPHFDIQAISREDTIEQYLKQTSASDQIKHLIANCCDRDPTKRPTINNVILCIDNEIQKAEYNGTFNGFSHRQY